MIMPEETAADRARAFLEMRGARDELFPSRKDHVIASTAMGLESRLLTEGDLRILLLQADALRHAAPHHHMALEVGSRFSGPSDDTEYTD